MYTSNGSASIRRPQTEANAFICIAPKPDAHENAERIQARVRHACIAAKQDAHENRKARVSCGFTMPQRSINVQAYTKEVLGVPETHGTTMRAQAEKYVCEKTIVNTKSLQI